MDRRVLFGCTAAVAGVTLIVILALGAMAYTPVEHGTVALVIRFGAVTGQVLQPGINWRVPFVDSVVRYRTQILVYETTDQPSTADYYDIPIDTTTADGQRVSVKYSVRFGIDPTRVADMANTLGDEAAIVSKVVKFHSRILARNIPKQYKVADLSSSGIPVVQEQFRNELEPLLRRDGVILEDLVLRKIAFEEE